MDFRHPGTMTTPILFESGTKINKITKLMPELPRDGFWEPFWITFVVLGLHFGGLLPSHGHLSTTLAACRFLVFFGLFPEPPTGAPYS